MLQAAQRHAYVLRTIDNLLFLDGGRRFLVLSQVRLHKPIERLR